MTLGKATGLVAGFIGAMALGVWVGPHVTNHDINATAPAVVSPAANAATTPAVRASSSRAESAIAREAATVPATAPALGDRLAPVLTRGTNMEMAAKGFANAETFATVAYASRNTEVPFVLLKHRVLNEHRTLADAIAMSNPDVDATHAVTVARAQARADVLSVDKAS
jgi:hypothetical protein